MAEYTIELKDIVENHNIFDFDYPFHDESKRKDFERKFIRHFYFNEICCDTIDRFKLFLEDKMNTVFPYYNELLRTATMDYEIIDNYRLTETYKREVEREERSKAENSAVGRTYEDSRTETETDRTADTVGNVTNTGGETHTGNSVTESETNETGNSKTSSETNETGNSVVVSQTSETSSTENNSKEVSKGLSSSETSETVSSEKSVKRYDTPMGSCNPDANKYLTAKETETGSNSSERSETGSNSSEKSVQSSTDTQTDGTARSETNTTNKTTSDSETDTTNNTKTNSETVTTDTINTNSETDSTGNEKEDINTVTSATGEQKTTADSNGKSHSTGTTLENYTIERIGNIGVDTDSDVINKHLNLQKRLHDIYNLFFAECEDLFMLVY